MQRSGVYSGCADSSSEACCECSERWGAAEPTCHIDARATQGQWESARVRSLPNKWITATPRKRGPFTRRVILDAQLFAWGRTTTNANTGPGLADLVPRGDQRGGSSTSGNAEQSQEACGLRKAGNRSGIRGLLGVNEPCLTRMNPPTLNKRGHCTHTHLPHLASSSASHPESLALHKPLP